MEWGLGCTQPRWSWQPPVKPQGRPGVLHWQVAYAVEADEDGAVRLACNAVESGGLYPEEVHPCSCTTACWECCWWPALSVRRAIGALG